MRDETLFQFSIAEDKPDLAEGYIRGLSLDDLEPQISRINNDDDLLDSLSSTIKSKVYWVDIHFGEGRDSQGIFWIKTIREKCPDALIIVVTGHPKWKQKCLEIGANYFYEKGGQYESKILKIREDIIRYLKDQNNTFRLNEYYASVVNVGKETVKVECYLDNGITEGYIPLEMLMDEIDQEPMVNDFIKIAVIKKRNSLKYVFNLVADVPDELKERLQWDEEDGDDDLLDSDFWTNTKK